MRQKKYYILALQGPSGPPALAPALKGWIPAYHSDPMDQSHTLDPAPEPHSTNLRVRSDYLTMIKQISHPKRKKWDVKRLSYLLVADLRVTPLIFPFVVSTTKSSVIIAWQAALNNNIICNEDSIT